MSYKKKTWVTGEKIIASDLNNMETGIEKNSQDIEALNTSALSKSELNEAINTLTDEIDKKINSEDAATKDELNTKADKTELSNYQTKVEAASDKDELTTQIGVKQDKLKPGTGVEITADNTINCIVTSSEPGSSNYNDLINKPQINGNELSGNMTTEQLGITIPDTSDLVTNESLSTTLNNYQTTAQASTDKQDVEAKIELKQDKLTAGTGIEIAEDNTINCTVVPGSSEGGTSDYDQLINKPKINGVELTGDLSTEQLKIEIPDITQLTEDVQDVVTDLGTKANASELESLQTEVSELQTTVQSNTTEIANINGDLANETAEREEADRAINTALDKKMNDAILVNPLERTTEVNSLCINSSWIDSQWRPSYTSTALQINNVHDNAMKFANGINGITIKDNNTSSLIYCPLSFQQLTNSVIEIPLNRYYRTVFGYFKDDGEFRPVIAFTKERAGTASYDSINIIYAKVNADFTTGLNTTWTYSGLNNKVTGTTVKMRFSGTTAEYSSTVSSGVGKWIWNIAETVLPEIQKITHLLFITNNSSYPVQIGFLYNSYSDFDGSDKVVHYTSEDSTATVDYLKVKYDDNTIKVNEQGQLYANVQQPEIDTSSFAVKTEVTEEINQAKTDLQSEISSKVDSSALDNYVQTDNLNSTLEGYVQTESLTSTLSSYATTDSLQTCAKTDSANEFTQTQTFKGNVKIGIKDSPSDLFVQSTNQISRATENGGLFYAVESEINGTKLKVIAEAQYPEVPDENTIYFIEESAE